MKTPLDRATRAVVRALEGPLPMPEGGPAVTLYLGRRTLELWAPLIRSALARHVTGERGPSPGPAAGGRARAAKLTPARRREIARQAAQARWSK